MTRRQKDPLRRLTPEELVELEGLSRSQREPASHVARAKVVLAVAAGLPYTAAAHTAGRRSGDAVAQMVARFNQRGLAAVVPDHGGGRHPTCTVAERNRILAEARRTPDREREGTATWSLTTLRHTLRTAPNGLPTVSTGTIRAVLLEAGWSWQRSRSWCETGTAQRKRKCGIVTVIDPDAEAKKTLIERAYMEGERLGLAVWGQDEAGPFQTIPYPAESWTVEGQPVRQPHEYHRDGTAKMLTLFHPVDGQVRVKGVTSTVNTILHPWLKAELSAIVATLPAAAADGGSAVNRAAWVVWQEGLTVRITLPTELPPLRMLLVWDNLAGHYTPELVLWMFSQGIMPLYTPLSGSWLNMTESIQRILKRRALEGHHPQTADEIMTWLEATARGWNRHPTPCVWGGKRALRRARRRARAHVAGGSGACMRQPVRRRRTIRRWCDASTCRPCANDGHAVDPEQWLYAS